MAYAFEVGGIQQQGMTGHVKIVTDGAAVLQILWSGCAVPLLGRRPRGMFADGGGFAIAPPTLASLAVVVGGISPSPVEADAHIEQKDLLDLTVSIDHNVVDGAPATRFAAELRQILRRAVVFTPDGGSPR